MALHGYVNTTHATCWDVDAYNMAGVYTTGDLDNGVMVTLTKMAQNSENVANGFEYEVAPASANSTGVWVVASPEVGSTIMQQELADPREFYNEKGRTMSIKYLMPKVDCIEVTAECFTNGTLPTSTENKVIIGAGGKLTATNADQTATTGAYFTLEALHTVTIGMKEVPSAILRCARN